MAILFLPLVNQNGYAVFSTRAGLQCSSACFQGWSSNDSTVRAARNRRASSPAGALSSNPVG
ncbi:hypothetical protein A234_23555, partial [Pseudomonas syringae pv. actinidiae ICMP 19101]